MPINRPLVNTPPPIRIAKDPPSGGRVVLQFFRIAIWGVCIIFVLAEWASTSLSLGSKEISAIQQSGLAAMGCFQVLVAYVICRAIDSMTR